jgi:hypothetical protein
METEEKKLSTREKLARYSFYFLAFYYHVGFLLSCVGWYEFVFLPEEVIWKEEVAYFNLVNIDSIEKLQISTSIQVVLYILILWLIWTQKKRIAFKLIILVSLFVLILFDSRDLWLYLYHTYLWVTDFLKYL